MKEHKIKHLEFIHSNIARMNQCSFQMKGWAITIVSALLAIYATTVEENGNGNVGFIFVAIAPTVVFWILDSYYLQQERKFRGIYNDTAELTNENTRTAIRDFEMPLRQYKGFKYSFLSAFMSITECSIYLGIILGLAIAGCILK